MWVQCVCVLGERESTGTAQAQPSRSLSLPLSSSPSPLHSTNNKHQRTHTPHIPPHIPHTNTHTACMHPLVILHSRTHWCYIRARVCRQLPFCTPFCTRTRHTKAPCLAARAKIRHVLRKLQAPFDTCEREGRDRQEENGAATRGHSGFMHATHRHVWPVAYWCSRASCADPSNPPSQPTKKKVQFALSTHAACLCLRFFWIVFRTGKQKSCSIIGKNHSKHG